MEIFAAQGAPPVSRHRWCTLSKWKKSSIIKCLIILFGHLWEVEILIDTFLPSSSLEGLSSLILFALVATGVFDTGGKFVAGVVDTGGTLELCCILLSYICCTVLSYLAMLYCILFLSFDVPSELHCTL